VRQGEKGETDSKTARRKNTGENTGLFLILLLLLHTHAPSPSLSLSFSTSLSLVFWIFGKVVKGKKKKKNENEKRKKMTVYYPQILSIKIAIIFERLHLSLCDHLLGI